MFTQAGDTFATVNRYIRSMLRALILSLFLLFTFSTFAGVKDISRRIAFLRITKQKIFKAEVMDKFQLNQTFTDTLRAMLNDYESYDYGMDSISIFSVVKSVKGNFKIYTWAIEDAPNSYIYFGFTQYLLDKRKQKLKVCLLTSEATNDQQYSELDTSQWLGAIYYNVIPQQKRRDDKFLLLGWDGNTSLTNKKVIEVISFDKKGIPTFGANIFRTTEYRPPRGKKNYRIVIEYSAKVSLTLRWDEDLEMIVFDHLAPSSPRLQNVRAAYVPDFSYDALVYENGYWVQKSNVDARNQKMQKAKKYRPEDYHK